MKIYIAKDFFQLSKKAAEIIQDAISEKPDLVLGLATGSTPLGTYKELIRMHKEEKLDFSRVISFNLDEYYPISPENKQSYFYYMKHNFFRHININPENIHVPDGQAEDAESHCKVYEAEIRRHKGIDLQLLGIGENGHIGFNEPDDEIEVLTHLTKLSESTLRANSRFFDSKEKVPCQAITMGLGSIMKAKKILLLASGIKKAEIIAKLLTEQKATTNIPASALLLHNDVTVLLDEEAAGIYKMKIKNQFSEG